MKLAVEKSFFDQIKKSLEDQEGRFVLIKGQKLIGVFADAETAFKTGVEMFGHEDFLVTEVRFREKSAAVSPFLARKAS